MPGANASLCNMGATVGGEKRLEAREVEFTAVVKAGSPRGVENGIHVVLSLMYMHD